MCIPLLVLVWFLAAAGPATASITPAPPPLLQTWSDTGLISADDDWSHVTAVIGYRGDGLVTEPGVDPRTVVSDGSGTPVDVTANRTDPRAVGLAAGVTEFELADPVVAIQGSAVASAPQLVLSLDTRGRAEVSVRLVLRDIDASGSDAVEPVAVQYRVGASGDFSAAPGGYVADATTGPGLAALTTPVRATLPPAANGQPLVQVRVITTNAAGQDEWVGVDDIEVTAATAPAGPPPGCPTPPGPAPPVETPPNPGPAAPEPPALTDLALSPDLFMPTRRGGAIIRRGGTGLRFRLSRAARVRFEVIRAGSEPGDLAPKPDRDRVAPVPDARRVAPEPGASRVAPVPDAHRVAPEPDASRLAQWVGAARHAARGRRGATTVGGRFSAHGRRGLNRLRFSGRIRGRPLAPGAYILTALARDRAGRESAPAAARFRIGRPED